MLHLITCHGRIMPHLAELLLQNACEWVRMAPGRGHLCHVDTFLVHYKETEHAIKTVGRVMSHR